MKNLLWGLAISLCLGASALAADAVDNIPAQLNSAGFSACLTQAHAASVKEVTPLVQKYGFSGGDGLLIYLALYPGKYVPLISDTVQKPGLKRWSGNWEKMEAELADRLASGNGDLYPGPFFAESLKVCNDDPFCAALLAHNVLRTLGRNDQAIFHDPHTGAVEDRNPTWFRDARAHWQEDAAKIQTRLISFRRDGGGDRYGEWYHFWGIVAFGMHEAALGKNPGTIDFAAALNQLMNPYLAGGQEDPLKARVDKDSALVLRNYLNWKNSAKSEGCENRMAYVLPQ